MINYNQTIELTWNPSNRIYWESKGYPFTQYKDKFFIKVKDLKNTSHQRVDVICDVCNKSLDIEYRDYKKNISRNNKYVCQSCSVQIKHYKTIEKRRKDYIERLQKQSEKNGYTLLLDNIDMITSNTSIIEYLCPIHGKQSMRLANYLSGRKCPHCATMNNAEHYKLKTNTIITRVQKCGGKILNPEEYINQSVSNLIFECSECGNTFTSSFRNFTQHGGQICKSCSNQESLGEKKIRYYLEEHNINYTQEYWFYDCRDKNPLPFDFYLTNFNTIIEFDGRQHFENTNYFTYSFDKVKMHDKIKNDYCKKNNIKLIRIPYTKINHINQILDKELFT